MRSSFLRVALLVVAASSLAAVTGCAAHEDEETSESEDAVRGQRRTTVFTAKLYEADYTPTEHCDIHTVLTITETQGRLVANLEDRRDGACELFVERNARSYKLEEVKEACGSTLYKAAPIEGETTSSITIQDNLGRKCRDKRPALIEVEETTDLGSMKLFGKVRTAPETRPGPSPRS